jgi:hypothetical protein
MTIKPIHPDYYKYERMQAAHAYANGSYELGFAAGGTGGLLMLERPPPPLVEFQAMPAIDENASSCTTGALAAAGGAGT